MPRETALSFDAVVTENIENKQRLLSRFHGAGRPLVDYPENSLITLFRLPYMFFYRNSDRPHSLLLAKGQSLPIPRRFP